MNRVTELALILAAVAAVLVTGPASAADIYVDTTNDLYMGNCIIHCSLRDAILVSNANGQDDTIHVPAGHYSLTIPNGPSPSGEAGDLFIDSVDAVAIVGEGPGVTVIDGNAIDRVFRIDTGSGSVTLQGLTITGGSPAGSGGGIFNWDSTLIVNSCEIVANQVTAADRRGAGIFNEAGLLWMNDTVVSFNTSAYTGGGLYLGDGSTTQLVRCTLNNNHAHTGGAVHTRGTSYFNNVTFYRNTADGGADGLWVEGSSTLTHCTLYQLDIAEEAIFCQAGGALTTLKNSIVVGSCNADAANIDAMAGNVEYGDTCHMGYGNYPDAGSYHGLMQFGWHGGGVPTQELGEWGVADDYVFTDTYLLPEDARCSERPVGPYGDAGAFERVPNEIFSHGFENRYTTGWSSTAP